MSKLQDRHDLECKAAGGDKSAYNTLLNRDLQAGAVGDFHWPTAVIDKPQPAGDPSKGQVIDGDFASEYCAAIGVSSAAATLVAYALKFLPVSRASTIDVDEGKRYGLSKLRVRVDVSVESTLTLELLNRYGYDDVLVFSIDAADLHSGWRVISIEEGERFATRKNRRFAQLKLPCVNSSVELAHVQNAFVGNWMVQVVNAAQHMRLYQRLNSAGKPELLQTWLQGRVYSHIDGVVVPPPT